MQRAQVAVLEQRNHVPLECAIEMLNNFRAACGAANASEGSHDAAVQLGMKAGYTFTRNAQLNSRARFGLARTEIGLSTAHRRRKLYLEVRINVRIY